MIYDLCWHGIEKVQSGGQLCWSKTVAVWEYVVLSSLRLRLGEHESCGGAPASMFSPKHPSQTMPHKILPLGELWKLGVTASWLLRTHPCQFPGASGHELPAVPGPPFFFFIDLAPLAGSQEIIDGRTTSRYSRAFPAQAQAAPPAQFSSGGQTNASAYNSPSVLTLQAHDESPAYSLLADREGESVQDGGDSGNSDGIVLQHEARKFAHLPWEVTAVSEAAIPVIES